MPSSLLLTQKQPPWVPQKAPAGQDPLPSVVIKGCFSTVQASVCLLGAATVCVPARRRAAVYYLEQGKIWVCLVCCVHSLLSRSLQSRRVSSAMCRAQAESGRGTTAIWWAGPSMIFKKSNVRKELRKMSKNSLWCCQFSFA